MPKREDEYWAGQKDNLKYCSKHQRYYHAKVGCQRCFLEEQNLKRRVDEIPQLQKCPECKQKSLFWNKDFGLFECLNLQCKKRFARDEINREAAETTESDEIGKEQTHQALRKSESPDAGQDTMSQKARETSGIQELDKQQKKQDIARQESPSSRRAWFGKKYFHPKGTGWKKPKRAFPIKMDEVLKLTAKLLLVCAAIFCIVLGAHGLYVYFSGLEKVDLLVGLRDPSQLFMALSVPSWFGGIVSWATYRGIWSWFVPAAIVAGGIFSLYLQGKIYVGRNTKFVWAFTIVTVIAVAAISVTMLSSSNRIVNVAKVDSMSIGSGLDWWTPGGGTIYFLDVQVEPTSEALANRPYTVDLYENGKLRDSKTVSWDTWQINLHSTTELQFRLSQTEYENYYEKTYYSKDITKELSKYFTVRVNIVPYAPP